MTLSQLYERMIERYNEDSLEPYHTDYYTWSKVYKTHFDKFEITSKLKKHVVKTGKDNIPFDKSMEKWFLELFSTFIIRFEKLKML